MKNDTMSERELCDVVIADIKKHTKYEVYTESCGFDFIVVDRKPTNSDTPVVMGVEAKTRPNIEVLAQQVAHLNRKSERVSFYATLTPKVPEPFRVVARMLKVLAFNHATPSRIIQQFGLGQARYTNVYYHGPSTVTIPEQMNDAPAGMPSPYKMTEWKQKALKLLVKLEVCGRLEKSDFTAAKVSTVRWLKYGWLVRKLGGAGSMLHYVKGSRPCPVINNHPQLFAAMVDKESRVRLSAHFDDKDLQFREAEEAFASAADIECG